RNKNLSFTDFNELANRDSFHWLKERYDFQADPFIVELDSNIYLFYEALDLIDSKGILRCSVLDSDLHQINDAKLEGFDYLNSHLSFPFVFYYENDFYLMPESHETGNVSLFKAKNFPYDWVFIGDLIENIALTDSVIFFLNNQLWMMSSDMNNELVVHVSDHLLGPWKKTSPITKFSNFHHRLAGSPFSFNNKNYVPIQECHIDDYGKSIFIKEIELLNEEKYIEKTIGHYLPFNARYPEGFHTINFSENYVVVDSKVKTFNILTLVIKCIYRLKVKLRNVRIRKGKA
ncbi:hypothetical protein DVQ06_17240, partial [Yersinia enterocolitica]|nr:hypothetical protein [Yersinia enterocolitica]